MLLLPGLLSMTGEGCEAGGQLSSRDRAEDCCPMLLLPGLLCRPGEGYEAGGQLSSRDRAQDCCSSPRLPGAGQLYRQRSVRAYTDRSQGPCR